MSFVENLIITILLVISILAILWLIIHYRCKCEQFWLLLEGIGAILLGLAAVVTAYNSYDIYNGILDIQAQSKGIGIAVKKLDDSVNDIIYRYKLLVIDEINTKIQNNELTKDNINQFIYNYNLTKSPLMPKIDQDNLKNIISELQTTENPQVRKNIIIKNLQ